jgi:signal peptidase I
MSDPGTDPTPKSQDHVGVVSYASPEVRMVYPRRIGFLSLCASIYLPGLGQLLAGNVRRAGVVFGVYLAMALIFVLLMATPALVPAVIVILPIGLVFNLWNLVDGFRCGHRAPAGVMGHPAIKYPLGLLFVLAEGYIPPAIFPAMYCRAHLMESFVLRVPPPQYARGLLSPPGGAMAPTIYWGDRVMVHKRVGWTRWSVVAYEPPTSPGDHHFSRIVGLPGETVEIVGQVLKVNGSPLAPPSGIGPYKYDFSTGRMSPSMPGSEGRPITLGHDEYYVLGDNTEVALDSRYWSAAFPGHQLGALPADRILGRATYIYWPIGRWRKLY